MPGHVLYQQQDREIRKMIRKLDADLKGSQHCPRQIENGALANVFLVPAPQRVCRVHRKPL